MATIEVSEKMAAFLKWLGIGVAATGGVIAATSVAKAASAGAGPGGGSGSKPLPRSAPDPFDTGPVFPTSEATEGADVSTFIQWPKLRDLGMRFGIAKCSQGEPGKPYGHAEESFTRNRQAMATEEKIDFWGGYHYAILSQDPMRQAELCAAQLLAAPPKALDRMLPPALDLEWGLNDGKIPALGGAANIPNGPRTIEFMYVWNDRMRKLLGRKSMLYSSYVWWHSIGNPVDPIQQAYAWWLAQWGPPIPTLPKGVTSYAIHQWTGTKIVAGQSIDHCRFRGSPEDIRLFIEASKV